jgi:hypothetical protein
VKFHSGIEYLSLSPIDLRWQDRQRETGASSLGGVTSLGHNASSAHTTSVRGALSLGGATSFSDAASLGAAISSIEDALSGGAPSGRTASVGRAEVLDLPLFNVNSSKIIQTILMATRFESSETNHFQATLKHSPPRVICDISESCKNLVKSSGKIYIVSISISIRTYLRIYPVVASNRKWRCSSQLLRSL